MLARKLSLGLRGYSSASRAGLEKLLRKNPDDVVITFAKRTPMGRAKKGQFKDTSVDDLLHALFKATLERTGLNPAKVSDICVGTCHPPSPLYVSRAAALAAGIPEHVPISTVNRLCSSGLMAIRNIANDIKAGETRIGLAVGVESMSMHPRPTPEISSNVDTNAQAHDCIQPMGWTSEMVAQHYKVSREKQDEYAHRSHSRAAEATANGIFAEEILPVRIGEALVSVHDTVRPGVTLESLAIVKPMFAEWGDGSATAGNTSGLGDEAEIHVLMKRDTAEAEGLEAEAQAMQADII